MKSNKTFIYFLFTLTILGLSSCSNEEVFKETNPNHSASDRYEGLTEFQRKSLAYFKEICLGYEYGDAPELVRKWADNDTIDLLFEYRSPQQDDFGSLIQPNYYPLMAPPLPGAPPAPRDIRLQRREILLKSLCQVVDTINKLTAPSGFFIRVIEADGRTYYSGNPPQFNMPNRLDSESARKHNGIFIFAPRGFFTQRYPDATQLQESYGNGALWLFQQKDKSNPNRITDCRIMCVLDQPGAYDNDMAVLKSFILEEFIQPLGFFRDSEMYKSSIFYETPYDGGFSTAMSPLDKELVRLMYHPDIKIGMTGMEAENAILKIYHRENADK